jgi:carbohydrate-selective porin OprB
LLRTGWIRFAAVALIYAAPSCTAALALPLGPQSDEPEAAEPSVTEEKPGQPPLVPGGDLIDAFHQERQKLKDLGIAFSLHERSEAWADVSGGGRQGVSYNGITVAKLDLDLDKLFGWSGGEIFTSAFDIHRPIAQLSRQPAARQQHRGEAERQALRPVARPEPL